MSTVDLNNHKNPACLEAIELEISRGNKTVLRDINFSVCAGELVVVIGPNGAGKSSLLKAMSGELNLGRGSVVVHGLAVKELSLAQRARSIAVLSQQSNLNFPFSVAEVVEMGRMPFASSYQLNQSICREAMEVSDCWSFRERMYTQLSGGEQQRVQLARVFSQSWPAQDSGPQYVFLDEPNSALDLSHQKAVLDYCRRRASANAVVVLVLHDLNLACQYADRLLLLDEGQLVSNGSPWDVAKPELLRQVYGVNVEVVRHPKLDCPTVFL